MSAAANERVRAAWDRNAEFWDRHMGGDGNDFQRELVGRPSERLLAVEPGEQVLDIACGTGISARRLAELGARVVAFDMSAGMLAAARAHANPGGRIEYREIDASDEAALLSLGENRFDAAVCTMAIMDMSELNPLASALRRLMKPGARFVFSVCHPSFNQDGAAMLVERNLSTGETGRPAVKVTGYLTPFSVDGIGISGQPIMHPYFHRPLSLILAPFFNAGFMLDALEEPAFSGREGASPFSWESYAEIPAALVCRLRRVSS